MQHETPNIRDPPPPRLWVRGALPPVLFQLWRRSWMQRLDLSVRQVAMITSLRYSAACTGFVCRSAYLSSLPSWFTVRPSTGTGLPGRRHSAGRQDSRSITPAVIVDVGIGRPVFATVHFRWRSVYRRRGTNLEQFASRSDVIKFPANLQNQTKISFTLGVVPIVSKLFSVRKVPEVLRHFFTLHLM